RDAGAAHAGGGARAQRAVVDLAVAVVVDAVAHLELRLGDRALAPHAADAAHLADAAVGGAVLEEVLVGVAVAVVVETVADLFGRQHLADAQVAPAVADAGLHAAPALTLV